MLPVATAPSSVRNSIAECCGHVGTEQDSQYISIPAYPFSRLEDCTNSPECKQPYPSSMVGEKMMGETVSASGNMAAVGGIDSMLMDTTEYMKVCNNIAPTFADLSGNNNLVYTTGAINNSPPLMTTLKSENVVSASTAGQFKKMAIHNKSRDEGQPEEEGVSTITFKAPRV
ncbi:uncharacterized protein LOC118738790 [Rhagoletis pomonella]|uniref:uncharacterized protein LOC118738790 n=1 Tax=Rhagoletis pomonella TaxID=28610 RepID=UPI00177BB736|nr:uncharacterized protein LOC118738790 [Rhagoletis pomonella]